MFTPTHVNQNDYKPENHLCHFHESSVLLHSHVGLFHLEVLLSLLPVTQSALIIILFQDGMGSLRLKENGIHLEGVSKFQRPLYVNDIQSRRDSWLLLRSDKNVTLNARNKEGQLTGQLTVGEFPVIIILHSFYRNSELGRYACLKLINCAEGAVFEHSVETPLIQARTSEDLKLESPTRSLTMEAPRGVEVSAARGTLGISSRKDLQLESTEGEILLDASSIRLGSLPLGTHAGSPSQAIQKQAVYEVCVCPSGKIYLSPAESSSSCQAMSNICLWS
uniref:Sarcoglycan zeta n=1 Tax=Oryzias sinensis TaxID=183150 RepID=A0A8C7WXB0_9TELE